MLHRDPFRESPPSPLRSSSNVSVASSSSAAVVAAAASSDLAAAAVTESVAKVTVYIPIYVYKDDIGSQHESSVLAGKLYAGGDYNGSVFKADLLPLLQGEDPGPLFERLAYNLGYDAANGVTVRVSIDSAGGVLASLGAGIDLKQKYKGIMLLVANVPNNYLHIECIDAVDQICLNPGASIAVSDILELRAGSVFDRDLNNSISILPPARAREQRVVEVERQAVILKVADYINYDHFWIKEHAFGAVKKLPIGIEAMRQIINDPASQTDSQKLLRELQTLAQAGWERNAPKGGWFGLMSKRVDPNMPKPLKVQFYQAVIESRTMEELLNKLQQLCGPAPERRQEFRR